MAGAAAACVRFGWLAHPIHGYIHTPVCFPDRYTDVEAAHPIHGYIRTPVCFPDRDTDVHHVLYSLRIPIVHPLHLIHDLYNNI